MRRVMPEMGCVIDGSHMNWTDFTIAVIEFAIERGFELDVELFRQDVADMQSDSIFEDYAVIMDSLDWTYEDALEYLNSITPADYFYLVEDQSLFLEMTSD